MDSTKPGTETQEALAAELLPRLRRMAEKAATQGFALEIPPRSMLEMDGRFEHYENRKVLHCSFDSAERFTNPMQVMQGGFIAAAVDNTMGPLSYLAANQATTTLDLNVSYIRPVKTGRRLRVEAQIVSRGRRTMYMEAQVCDADGKLLAKATSHMLILQGPPTNTHQAAI